MYCFLNSPLAAFSLLLYIFTTLVLVSFCIFLMYARLVFIRTTFSFRFGSKLSLNSRIESITEKYSNLKRVLSASAKFELQPSTCLSSLCYIYFVLRSFPQI